MWFNCDRRASFLDQLNRLAIDGRIGAMQAINLLTGIEFEFGRLREGKAGRADLAYRLGQEIAAETGLAVLAGVAKTAALG